MIQIIPRAAWGAGFVNSTQYIGVVDGEGNIPNSDTFGPSYARAPIPMDGIARNLVIYSRDARHGTTTVTLMKNGSPTSLAVTLPTGDTISPVSSGEIDFVIGDDWSYRISGPGGLPAPPFGYDIAMSLEYECAGNIFCLTPDSGGKAVDRGYIGGGFGNGFWENYDAAIPVTLSTSYSITAVVGAVTGLTLRAYDGAPGAGIWTGYVQKNGILQDGGGGTIDTATVMTGVDTVASRAFSVPVALTDHVDIVVIRTGIDAPFAFAQVGAGVAFTPTTDGQFMLCGGSNDVISPTAFGWKWTRSNQLATPETANLAPVGPNGFQANGLYVERGQAPGNTKGFIHTLRQNEASTAIFVTIQDLAQTGNFIGATLDFVDGDTITLQIEPFNTPASGGFFWGLALSTGGGPPPPPDIESACPVDFPVETPSEAGSACPAPTFNSVG